MKDMQDILADLIMEVLMTGKAALQLEDGSELSIRYGQLTYYLLGPMSGFEDYNYPVFERTATLLRGRGMLIKSPHEIDYCQDGSRRGSKPYSTYMRGGFKLLIECGGIVLLPGWPRSRGARAELDVALDCDMEVLMLTRDDLLIELDTGRLAC